MKLSFLMNEEKVFEAVGAPNVLRDTSTWAWPYEGPVKYFVLRWHRLQVGLKVGESSPLNPKL